MSTKFSVRPAPRKRPWICKRSPPCLIPTPLPKSLLCTFDIQRYNPPQLDNYVRGSLTLLPFTGPTIYYGLWSRPPKSFAIIFNWTAPQGPGQAEAWWQTGSEADRDYFPIAPAPRNPALKYEAYTTIHRWMLWLTTVLITE